MAASDVVRTYSISFSTRNPRKHWPPNMTLKQIADAESHPDVIKAMVIHHATLNDVAMSASCTVSETPPLAP